MTSTLFKRAFVRGLNVELVRNGTVRYPTKEAADHVADFVADNSGMSDPIEDSDGLTKEAAVSLCQALIGASRELSEHVSFNDVFAKTASAADPVDVANHDAWDIMEKCAAETGSIIQGGDHPNDLPAAAEDNGEAGLEINQRPENYANLGEHGVGNYERKGQGHVGTEETHPEAPHATDHQGNSLTEMSGKHANFGGPAGAPGEMYGEHEDAHGGMPEEGIEGSEEGVSPELIKGLELGLRLSAEDPESAAQLLAAHDQEQEEQVATSGGFPAGGGGAPPMGHPAMEPPPPEGLPKQASFADVIRKMAMDTGTLARGGASSNTLSDAATYNGEAALELHNRPEGYANVGVRGVGNSVMNPTAAQRIGTEQPHPLAPGATGHTSNSITEFGKSAFDQVFQSTATQIVPFLPTKMDDNTKVAHVRAAMGLTRAEQGQYLEDLYSSLGAEKTAAYSVNQQFVKSAQETAANKPVATSKQASVGALSNLKRALARLEK